jgi:hypothetical protein
MRVLFWGSAVLAGGLFAFLVDVLVAGQLGAVTRQLWQTVRHPAGLVQKIATRRAALSQQVRQRYRRWTDPKTLPGDKVLELRRRILYLYDDGPVRLCARCRIDLWSNSAVTWQLRAGGQLVDDLHPRVDGVMFFCDCSYTDVAPLAEILERNRWRPPTPKATSFSGWNFYGTLLIGNGPPLLYSQLNETSAVTLVVVVLQILCWASAFLAMVDWRHWRWDDHRVLLNVLVVVHSVFLGGTLLWT